MKRKHLLSAGHCLLGLILGLGLFTAASLAYAGVAYVENFDSGDGGFTASGVTSWAWGAPTSGPGSAHSGSNVWATTLAGDYGTNEDGYVTSPPIDLSGYTNHEFILTWWQYLVTESGFDFASVEVSDNGGGTWAVVYGEASGAVSPAWTRQAVRLEPSFAVSNFRVRFHLRSDASANFPGFYLDDVEVRAIAIRSNTNQPLAIYRNTFEANDGQFTVSGVSSWAWGFPASGPESAHSGSNVWATGLSGFYDANEDGYLASPPIDLSAYPGRSFTLSWWQYLVTEANCDFAGVEVTRDRGATWDLVYGEVSGEVSTTWMNPSVMLDSTFAVPDFQVRFRLRSDESLNNFGFYLDDVEIAVVLDQLPTLRDLHKGANINQAAPFLPVEFNTNFFSADSLVLVRIESLPARGALKLDGNPVAAFEEIDVADLGRLVYEPAADYTGLDSFRWNGSDFLFYAGSSAQVLIKITAPPTPGPDSVMALQSTTVCFPAADLLANDTDPEATRLGVAAVNASSQMGGVPVLFGGIIYYTPPPLYLGTDTFAYTLIDGDGGMATGTVAVTVAPAQVQKMNAPTLNLGTGLFEQTVRVSNPLTNQVCGLMSAVRVLFENLPGGGRIANATGTNAGKPFILYTNSLAPGQSGDLLVKIYTTNRIAPTNIIVSTQVLPQGAPAGTPGVVRISRVLRQPAGSILVEFDADPGRSYVIQRSSDLIVWTTTSPVLVAPSRRVQWSDTLPLPGATANQFYRVLRMP